MGSDEPAKKKQKAAPAPADDDGGLGGLYDFLPPPDPQKDEKAKVSAAANHKTRPKLPPADSSRVIFLDVDGVLLASGAVDTIVVDGVALPAKNRVQEGDFSAQALGSLRSIVQQTGAVIVLSSEWRRTEELRSSISAVLRSQDIPTFKDWTPIFQPRPEIQKVNAIYAWCERRAREIGKWLKDHPDVNAWVALDDLDFEWADSVRQAGTPWMKIRSVHTNDKICLTEDDATEAVRLLQYPPQEPKVMRKPTSMASSNSGSGGLLVSTEDTGPDRIRLG